MTTITYPADALDLSAAVRRYNAGVPPSARIDGYAYQPRCSFVVELVMASGVTVRLTTVAEALAYIAELAAVREPARDYWTAWNG
jgi:hypothetical protein